VDFLFVGIVVQCTNNLSYNELELRVEASMNPTRHFVLILSITLVTTVLQIPIAGAEQPDSEPDKIFKSDDTMDVILSGPWRNLNKKSDEDIRWPAQLTYTDSNGDQHKIDIEVAPRGLTRREVVCDFPPLKLHFDKEKMKGTAFRGNASLKLVSWCHKSLRYQDYNLKEYLAYRVYNLVTEKSFRTRSLNISWVDNEAGGEPMKRFGFLIEDPDELAKRNDLVKLATPKVHRSRLDPMEASRYAMFQYLIGNLDWSSTGGRREDKCCHNSRLIGTAEDANPVFAIPYDFDSSGVVDAHYALPPEKLPVRRITQRLFRGFCLHRSTLPMVREEFMAQKASIIGLYRDEVRLSDKARKKALKYIEAFFTTVSDPKKFQDELIDKCRS
jgi:hypothetical protein